MSSDALTIPQTLVEAIKHFANPENAYNFVKALRWPDGIVTCPFCASSDIASISSRKSWRCRTCKKQFSIKSGTIFQGSPLPLETWLTAVWMLTNAKAGLSSYALARAIGVTQQTAWFMAHRIRYAMKQGSFAKLNGTVEVDETYVGGKAKNMHSSRRREMRTKGFPKVCVMGFKERDGAVRLRVIKNNKAENVQAAIAEVVEAGATLYTDAARAYNGVEVNYNHATINHDLGQYTDGEVTTNRVEGLWSVHKRIYHGAHIHYSFKHSQKYCDETEFKQNTRTEKDGARFAMAVAGVGGKRLDYRGLVDAA